MTTITHLCTGYLFAQILQSQGIIPDGMYHSITVVSMIAANAPDFDVIAIRKIMHHRTSVMHVPLYWAIGFIAAGIFAALTHNRSAALYIIVSGINVIMHFLMDSVAIGHGIRWLFPFSKKQFGIIFGTPSETVREFIRNFFKYPIVIGEIALWIATYFVKRGIWHV
jgi:hypothetical protein